VNENSECYDYKTNATLLDKQNEFLSATQIIQIKEKTEHILIFFNCYFFIEQQYVSNNLLQLLNVKKSIIVEVGLD
jgi:hypothetical protein